MAKKEKLNYAQAGLHKITKQENAAAFKKKQFVVEATGEIISGARARQLAGSQAPSRQSKAYKDYQKFVAKFTERKNRELVRENLNPNFTAGEAASNPDFQRAYTTFRNESKKKKADRKAHGPLAEALEDLGVREENADYPVGETPD